VDGDVAARALELAHEPAAKPPRALANIKRLVRGSLSRPLAEGLADERTLFCDVMVDPETIELMAEMNAGRRSIRDANRKD
jgi:enoyl-CoA hydratase